MREKGGKEGTEKRDRLVEVREDVEELEIEIIVSIQLNFNFLLFIFLKICVFLLGALYEPLIAPKLDY